MAKSQLSPDSNPNSETVTWQACEYQDYHRGTNWYLGVAGVVVVLAAGSYLLAGGDPLPPVAIALMATIFVGYALHPPNRQTYAVGPGKIQVGPQSYRFNQFQAFNILKTGPVSSLYLPFNRRLIPPLTIPLPPDPALAEKISRQLGEVISYNPDCQPHPIDRLMHRLRF